MSENWSGAQATGPAFLSPEGVGSASGPVSNLGHANPQPDFWAGASPYLMGDRFDNPLSTTMEDSDLSPTVPLSLIPEPGSYWTPPPQHHPTPLHHQTPRLVQPPPAQDRAPIQYGPGSATHASSGPVHVPYGYQRAEHPNATMTLVFGVVGLVVPILSFVAWYLGGQARAEIRRGAPYAWDGGIVVGYWLGKVLGILTIITTSLSALLLFLSVLLQVSLFAMFLSFI